MSFKPNLPDPERILYAALAPCPQTFSVLKSACRTWEDHLWAQISILCEEKQTADMIKLGGGFWDGGLAVLENMPSPPSQEEDAAEEEEWERETTSTLETLGSVHVEEGYDLHTCICFRVLTVSQSHCGPCIPRLPAGNHPRSDKFIARNICSWTQGWKLRSPINRVSRTTYF
jgi:hypothetical protein